MTLRDDLEPIVDDARSIVDDFGLRPFVVTVRSITWSGGRPGSGTATNTDIVIDPAPKVAEVPLRLRTVEGGRFEDGDRVVTKISRSYTESQLTGGTPATAKEVVWLIGTDEYRLVSEPMKKNFEWQVLLRRITD